MSINARSGFGSFTWHETLKKCCGASNRIPWNHPPRSASAGTRLACLTGFGQDVGLVNEVAEAALQAQGFGGEGAGGFDGAGGVVEAGQLLAAGGGLDPEAELADLNGFLVQVHAAEVVLEDLAVEIEEAALAAEFLKPSVGESDVQAGVAFVYGAEQAAEVEPDGLRVVGVALLEGMLEGFGG